ncbi:unnamed protein product [Bathycoccus prasinos]
MESRCRDGVCQAPYEFPSFGRFGCKADCGPAQNLLQILNSQAVSALDLMGQVKWNLCLKDPGRESGTICRIFVGMKNIKSLRKLIPILS